MLIYLITNNVNGKVYVGKLAHKRKLWNYWAENVAKALKHRMNKPYLYAAIRKHGAENFSVKQIDQCKDPDELCQLEIKWIAQYQSNNPDKGYNLTIGGEGNSGHLVSAEARAKIGASHKGKPLSEEHKQKLRERKLANPVRYWEGKQKGDQLSEEGRKSIIEHSTGRKMSPEAIAKRVVGWKATMEKKGWKIQKEEVNNKQTSSVSC
jgi:group I intron endonuclease